MKRIFVYLLALAVLLPSYGLAFPDDKKPQKPPKITRPNSNTSGKTNSGKTNTRGKTNTSGKTQAQRQREEEQRRKEEELRRKEEELKKREAELKRQEDAERRKQEEELKKREAELKRQEDAERRKQEEERLRQEAERKRKQAEEERRQREQALQTLSNRTFTANGVSFTMVGVQGGTFQMGSNDGYDFEKRKPVHSVTLSSYYIGQTEVTQALWKAVMGKNPIRFKGDNLPVEKVSWNDCQSFIRKLNQLTGEHFRLPTEAEWEFAARGGNRSQGYQYSGSNTLGDVAWYTDNSSGKAHPVAQKQANELGIYDMNGNVREWCQDWYGDYSSSAQTNPTGPTSGSSRVNRGGGWSDTTRDCRSVCRYNTDPDNSFSRLGLRLVL